MRNIKTKTFPRSYSQYENWQSSDTESRSGALSHESASCQTKSGAWSGEAGERFHQCSNARGVSSPSQFTRLS